MAWARLDDGFPNNPKVKRLTLKAKWLQVVSLCYCARNLTDGALDAQAVKVVLAEADVPRRTVEELHEQGLWNRTADGFLINDFHEYNPSAEAVREKRRANAERQRRHRQRNPDGTYQPERNGESNALHNASRNAVCHATPSRPVLEVKTLGAENEFERLLRAAQAAKGGK